MRGLSNYPPGHPTGHSKDEVSLVCRNEECPEEGIPVVAVSVYERETGAAWIEPEDANYCEECGNERDYF